MNAIAIGVKFDKLRNDRQRGSISLIMRRDGVARVASTGLIGSREMRTTLFRPLLLRGIKILYCIIEKLHESGEPFSLDDVVSRFKESSGINNHEYDRLIRLYSNGFPINENIARISSNYRNEFIVASVHEETKQDACTSLTDFFDILIKELKGEGRIGTARNYRSTLKTVTDFINSRSTRKGKHAGAQQVKLHDINAKFVRDYAKYLNGKNISADTVSFYMRVFRAVLNTAAERELCIVESEWFVDINTSVGKISSDYASKVLDKATLFRLSDVDLSEYPDLQLSRDLFMFAFHCKGMELIDVLNLKPTNITDGFIVYRRRQKGAEVKVKIVTDIQAIIDRYYKLGNEYIFPMLENRDSSYFFSARNIVNRDLRIIGKKLALDKSLTFNMNIYTWKSLTENTNLTSALIS